MLRFTSVFTAVIVVCVCAFSQQPATQLTREQLRASHDIQAASRVLPSREFEQFAPYWTAEPGWHTELQLRNNLVSDDLTVRPSLRLSDGTEVDLNPIILLSGEVRSIDLMDALANINSHLAGRADAYGSIVLRYNSKSMRNLYGSVMVHDTGHPIMYHLDAVSQATGWKAGSREGIWWLPNKSVKDYLILTNQASHSIRTDLHLYDASGQDWSEPIILSAGQTQRLSVRELLQASGFTGTYGGISVVSAADAGSLDTVHILLDEPAAFAATLKMFDHDPARSQDSMDFAGRKLWTTRAPMLALMHPDPALGLPSNTLLHPSVLVRNTRSQAIDITPRLHWRNAIKDGLIDLPTLTLKPFEARLLSIDDLQTSGFLPLDATWTQVSLSANTQPDDFMAVAASYDSTLRYGAQTPFSDQLGAHLEGGQWLVDSTHTSIIAAGNGGEQAIKALLTIHYNQGKSIYRLRHDIAPNDQWWLDFGQLIRTQVPDLDGHVLPTNLAAGAYSLREVSETEQNLLYEGKVITDKTFGHATYGCMVCCGVAANDFGLPFILADPTSVGVNETQPVDEYGYNACTSAPEFISGYFSSWSSLNTSVMTTPGTVGQFTGAAIGSAALRAHAIHVPTGDGRDARACPFGPANADGSGNVQNCPTSMAIDQTWAQPLQNDYPSFLTGVGILSRMIVGPVGTDFSAVAISEIVTPTGNTCPSNIKADTDFPTITFGPQFFVRQAAVWEGNSYPATYNAFYDQHTFKSTSNVLGSTNVTSCQATATQVYTCNGTVIGTFTLTNTYLAGFIGGTRVTFVAVSKQ